MNLTRTSEPGGAVVWNGSRHHPGGRQLFAEEWPPQEPPEVGLRNLRDLSGDEVAEILRRGDVEPALKLSMRFGVSVSTIHHIMTAHSAGVLRRGEVGR